MSISRFKFVSPGVYVKEIDKSRTPTEAPAMGPTIIGRSVKGPMMRPIRVDSYADFVEVFGEPNPGGYNGDVWRAAVTQAPAYGAYAAKAYLAFNGPVTFVRLGGFQNKYASSTGFAGWQINALPTSITTAAANAGAYGLFVTSITSSSANTYAMPPTTGALAAVFYVNYGTVGLVGSPLSGSSESITGSGATWVRSSVHGNMEFKLRVVDSAGATTTTNFNFDPSSKKFIRNVFNTNPASINSAINSTSNKKDYFLGESFETFVTRQVTASAGTNQSYAATIVALKGTDTDSIAKDGGNFRQNAASSNSGWVIGQHKGLHTDFVPNSRGEYPVQKLFRFVSLSEGEWNQNNIKTSITDIKPSPTRYEKYGTFTVMIRKVDDDDQNMQPLEVFSNVNLNPVSPNYIAKRIGDVYSTWDYDKKMFIEYGTYQNLSKFVRVEVDGAIDAGAGDDLADLLPFGFYGPKKFNTILVSGSGTGTHSVATSSAGPVFMNTVFFNSLLTSATSISGNAVYTASLAFPELPFVEDSTVDSSATSIDRVFFGLKTKIGSTKLFDQQFTDIVRVNPQNINEDTSGLLTYSTLFSLDDVKFKNSPSNTGSDEVTGSNLNTAYWAVGSRLAGSSVTAKNGFLTGSGAQYGLGGTNFQRVARFTMPLFGGFNGFDITEKEPFSEGSGRPLGAYSGTDKDETTSYAVNSIKVAIDSVSDPEVVETNIMTIPGVQNVVLTNKLMEVCEQRGDALAIIDIPGDFKSSWESYNSANVEVKPDVDTAVLQMRSRGINNSYGCTFFPAVLATDTAANALVALPSSVVALGVMGSSETASELWFAPAGFNRGGLSNGAAGFPVVGVKSKLTSKDRDRLYEVNINPIASFPAEGIVVFGQKTLQATPTALDRINVRRLMIYVKKEVSRIATSILFDPNLSTTWARFLNEVVPFLNGIQSRFGITEYRVTLDETTTTPELIDRNIVYAKVFLKPARAIEFIAVDFILTNTGASFDD
jgi:hypothetical protein